MEVTWGKEKENKNGCLKKVPANCHSLICFLLNLSTCFPEERNSVIFEFLRSLMYLCCKKGQTQLWDVTLFQALAMASWGSQGVSGFMGLSQKQSLGEKAFLQALCSCVPCVSRQSQLLFILITWISLKFFSFTQSSKYWIASQKIVNVIISASHLIEASH